MAIPKSTLDKSIGRFYSLRARLLAALGHDEPDPVAVYEVVDDLASNAWHPRYLSVRELAISTLIEAAYDAPNKPTRLIILKSIEEVLQGLASGRVGWWADDDSRDDAGSVADGNDDGRDDGRGPDGDGGDGDESVPPPSAEPLQQAA